MAQTIKKLAVLFADICGSTSLYDTLGDDAARHLIAGCIKIMVSEILPFQGVLIKTIGDEIMCSFPSAETALNAACAMQKAVKNSRTNSEKPLCIRVGFHYGLVISEANDIFGDTVNVAARVAGFAKADQIMTTAAVYAELPAVLQNQTQQLMSAELKGKQEQCDIYRVLWEEDSDDHTSFYIPAVNSPAENVDELHLRCGELLLTVNKDRPQVTAGRGEGCDIIVKTSFTSRNHVRFELRFGKFIIADQSTNGTYIQPGNGKIIRILHEEMILQATGLICLGQASFENSKELIEFAIIPK